MDRSEGLLPLGRDGIKAGHTGKILHRVADLHRGTVGSGTAGNIVAFGGRVLDHSEPKYLNSSDTPAFNKRRNLFALNFAKAHAADYLIL